jgi:hypothetical protein
MRCGQHIRNQQHPRKEVSLLRLESKDRASSAPAKRRDGFGSAATMSSGVSAGVSGGLMLDVSVECSSKMVD